jgi:Cu(I)/Ag(I) efflux system membrane fusion protein
MRLLGLSDEDIDEAIVRGRPTGISTVTTPMTGIVLRQNAFRGAYVNTGDVVFTIANPRVLWARLDAYASDFPWLRLGQEAEFETDAYPGQSFKGKVVFIDPEFDAETRVFKVGVLYRDEKGLLKPNMLVRAVVQARLTSGGKGTTELVTDGMMDTAQTKRTGQPPLVIPETAPLITGKRAIVYVALPDKPGAFEGREVQLGPRAQGYYIVRDGLAKGEEVVVNGNFKLDSAVQILARTSMMSGKAAGMPVQDYQIVETPPPPPAEAKADQRQRGAQYEVHQGHNRGRPAGSAPAAPETMPAPAVPDSPHPHGGHEPHVRQ